MERRSKLGNSSEMEIGVEYDAEMLGTFKMGIIGLLLHSISASSMSVLLGLG